jgi:hypothetical protein
LKTVAGRRDGNHDATQPWVKLILLNGFEVVAQVLDALADSRFVMLFHVLEERSPYRHFGGSMRGKAETEAENVCNVFLRECSSVPLGQSRQVGTGGFRRDRATGPLPLPSEP